MTSGKVPAKAFAVFAVALMLILSVVPSISSDPNNSDNDIIDTGAVSIDYHDPLEVNSTVSVDYNGIASADYNPVYDGKGWKAPTNSSIVISGTLTIDYSGVTSKTFSIPQGMVIKIIGDGSSQFKNNNWVDWDFKPATASISDDGRSLTLNLPSYWYGITYYQSGTFTASYTYALPGIDYVFAGWSTSPVEPDDENVEVIHPGDILNGINGKLGNTIDNDANDLYVVWYTPDIYYSIDDSIDVDYDEIPSISVLDSLSFNSSVPSGYTAYEGNHNIAYTRIYEVSGTVETSKSLPMGTYRSENPDKPSTITINHTDTYETGPWYDRETHYRNCYTVMQGNVILDNINIMYRSDADLASGKHGDDSNYGIFANGHRLIIGTDVKVLGGSDAESYIQITGGSRNGSTGSTDVVVFSGTYSNIVAGSNNQSLNGSTNLVIRGDTTVLDTVVGGNSGDKDGETEGNIVTGNTNVYMLGGCLPADSYQEEKIGTNGSTEDGTLTESTIPVGVILTESTILTGGSNNGKVKGDTNVFISGDAVLWDVQGGGRRGQSEVFGSVNVEVSGLAVIRHVLCGSITDGLDGEHGNGSPNDFNKYTGSVHKVKMTVKHGAMVASVFGAGYDTYYKPLYSSMFDSDASIDINIEGGTVGYVYGGGYRGAVGYSGNLTQSPSESPIKSISITVSGGSVGEVYGGGRGGVDKVLHLDKNGTLGDSGDGFEDSTGFAWTAANSIAIEVTGGTVGDIYGGGQSVAELTSDEMSGQDGVASVSAGSIDIRVTGGTVTGTIHGGGKGVDPNSNSVDSETVAIVWNKEDAKYEVGSIKWYSGCGDQYIRNHPNYASVEQTGSGDGQGINITVSGATVGNGSNAVFGAGGMAETYTSSISLNLDGTFKGGVYGTGESADTEVSGQVTVAIGNAAGTKVEGDVFGAGMNGKTDANSISVSIGNTGHGSTVTGTVFGAGDGSSATTDLSGSIGITIINSTVGDGTNAVFGAGNSAPTDVSGGSIIVSIDGSEMKGNVFGTASTAKTEADSVSVSIGCASETTVDGSVFGAGCGDAAESYVNSIYIDLGQATVGKNSSGVYGAGMDAPTYVEKSLTITVGYHGLATIVNGDVFGGGQNADTEDRDINKPQTSLTVSLNINGGTSGGSRINGSVYGAGEYGMVRADLITVNLGDGTGVAPVITGDVYGGGLGNRNQYSVESDRSVVLNNATVNGSIYAGTRNGNDGNTSAVPSTVTTTAEIDLIAGNVRQNVYGGGFQGTSVYNVTIRFGTPAVDNVHPANIPSPTDLRVTSIYGGAYYDPTSGSQAGDLVLGSATILIGSSGLTGGYVFGGYTNVGDAGSGARISISGNVFGDGSYSTVKEETVVEFDGYTQTSDVQSQRMMSVQLADVLRLISSHVDLSGSSQGGTGQLSERMSLYDIGSLNLHASSSLELYAGTSEIGALNSYNDENGNDLSQLEDFSGTGGNRIVLLGGVPATILGKDDDGIATEDDSPGVISGFTELDNGGNIYYGAFVLGSSQTDDNNGGFVVSNDSGGYDLASVLEYNEYIKIWFIAGATSVDKVLTFSADPDGGYESSSDSENVTIPKISEDSKLYYTGAYIDYESQNSMYVVDKNDGSTGTGKVVFDMVLASGGSSSVSVVTHTYTGGNWVLSTSSSNSQIGRQVSIESSLRAGWMEQDQYGHLQPASYGLLGYVVVQVIEAYDYGTATGSVQVPIHTIDIIVGMYVEPEDGKGKFNVTLVGDDDGLYTGTVYIPLSWKGVVTDYTFSNFKVTGFANGDDGFTLSAGTLMGMDGWSQTDYRDGYDISNGKVDFGSGGVAQPVLVLDYSGSGLSGNTGTLTFMVTLTPDADVVVGVTEYTITVIFSDAEPVHVYLQYTELISGDRYVLSCSDDGKALSWQKADDGVGYGFELPFNTSIQSFTFSENYTVGDGSYHDMTNVLNALIGSITSKDVPDGFVYSEHFAGWFSDPELIRVYNMGSNVSQDIVIYAKFGVKVTFDYGNNTAPYQTFIGYNTSLNDNGIFNYEQRGVDVTPDMIPGYDYFDGSRTYTGHYLLTANWIGDKSYNDLTPFSFTSKLMQDVTLYIAWGVEAYNVEIVVDFDGKAGPNGDWFTLDDHSDRNETDDFWKKDGDGGSIIFLADYSDTVTLTIAGGMHIGRGTTGTYGENQTLTFIGDSSSTHSISFRVPDAGDDYSKNNNVQIQVKITVTDLFDVTVELIYVDEFTSQLQGGDTLKATATKDGTDGLPSGTIGGTDSVSNGTITLMDLPVETLISLGTTTHTGAGYTYSLSVWVNGTLVGDDYELMVSGNNIDPVVTVALHRNVDILNQIDWDEAHISGINVYKVAVPDTPGGEWRYEYGSIWVSADDIQNVYKGSYQIRENDAFVIAPVNEYTIYDDPKDGPYCPKNTVRVVHEDVLYFSVTGTGDITLDTLTKIEQALNVYFEFIDSDGQQYTGSVDAIGSWSIQLVFGGQTYFITVGEASTNTALVVPYTIGQTVEYTASLEGFNDTEDRFGGTENRITVQLSIIGFKIYFHDLNNSIKEVGWTVFDGTGVPAPDGFKTADDPDDPGHGLFVHTDQNGAPLSFVSEITTGMFDASHNTNISAIAQPVGWADGVVTDGVKVLITTGTLSAGEADIGAGLFGEVDVTFTFDGKSITYDTETGVLDFNDARIPASGSVTLVSGGHMLTIYVIADAEAVL